AYEAHMAADARVRLEQQAEIDARLQAQAQAEANARAQYEAEMAAYANTRAQYESMNAHQEIDARNAAMSSNNLPWQQAAVEPINVGYSRQAPVTSGPASARRAKRL
ncbi:MAG TPA: hypothetical protein VEN30_16755, partial [Paraburkholderia sp.]|nr:hypothetical protein [Paraburkholderia sp.]